MMGLDRGRSVFLSLGSLVFGWMGEDGGRLDGCYIQVLQLVGYRRCLSWTRCRRAQQQIQSWSWRSIQMDASGCLGGGDSALQQQLQQQLQQVHSRATAHESYGRQIHWSRCGQCLWRSRFAAE
ncbi:hypothetical protein J3F83DRAFT_726793, partial [Trichoderma novae-zelandiae]